MSKKLIFFVIVMIAYNLVVYSPLYGNEDSDKNLIENSSFELYKDNNFENWCVYSWFSDNENKIFNIDSSIYNKGQNCALIYLKNENDARYLQKIELDSKKYYKVSCFMKTENVGNNSVGANIGILDQSVVSNDLKGTNDWTEVDLFLKSTENKDKITLTFGLGSYGSLNTGKLWIDNIKVEKLDNIPHGKDVFDLSNYKEKEDTNLITKSDEINGIDKEINFSKLSKENIKIFFKFLISFFIPVLIYLIIMIVFVKGYPKNKRFFIFGLVLICILAILVRFVLRIKMQGHPIDIGCFTAWANEASENLFGFYSSDGFSDYPPIYIIVLSIMGKIAKLLNIGLDHEKYILVISLPSIIADILIGIIIYKLASEKISDKIAIVLITLFVFNPLVILNSSIWGQVDSFFTLFILLMLIQMSKGNLICTNLILVISILIKPHGLIFIPIVFYNFMFKFYYKIMDRKNNKNEKFFNSLIYTLRNEYLRKILLSLISIIGTVFFILMLFKKTYNEPLWIIDLFIGTVSQQYNYATLNAFNFYAAVKANWVDDSEMFLHLSYNNWGSFFIILISILVGIMFVLLYDEKIPIITSLVLITGVYIFSSRMHERYMFPAIAITLLVVIYYKKHWILFLYVFLSFTNFINVWMVYIRSLEEDYWIPKENVLMRTVSVANILAFLIILIITVVFLMNKRIEVIETKKVESEF
ncbi:MAG: hypothetical protein ABF289_10865 [Clostridiales bacterium]